MIGLGTTKGGKERREERGGMLLYWRTKHALMPKRRQEESEGKEVGCGIVRQKLRECADGFQIREGVQGKMESRKKALSCGKRQTKSFMT